MEDKKYTVLKIKLGKNTGGTFETNKNVRGKWFNMLTKNYYFTKWERFGGFFDTKKDVVLMKWTLRGQDTSFDQNHISTFIMKLGLNPKYYDNPWTGVDSLGFSSNKYVDFTLFFIEKDNSIWMSIVLKNKKARRKFYQALRYLGNL